MWSRGIKEDVKCCRKNFDLLIIPFHEQSENLNCPRKRVEELIVGDCIGGTKKYTFQKHKTQNMYNTQNSIIRDYQFSEIPL